MEPEVRILGSGTMRTGGSLLGNLMSSHSKMFVLGERYHFFRFCYNRYNPLTEKNTRRLLEHQKIRLSHRFDVEFDSDEVFGRVMERDISYAAIYDEGMKYFLRKVERPIWGEYCALHWRDLPKFVNMFENAKTLHIFRDPRSVVSSWKHLSYAQGADYFNPVFNWIDSIQSMERYLQELPGERYMSLKYEDIMSEPERETKRICDHVGVEFEEEMLQPETWHARLPKSLLSNPQSAHEGKNIRGFSESRTKNWTKNLDDWEIALIEYLCEPWLKKYGYEPYLPGYSSADVAKGLRFLGEKPLIAQRLNHLITTGEGCPQYVNDPTDPKNWGSARKDMAARFIDKESEDAKQYFDDLSSTETKLAELYGPD